MLELLGGSIIDHLAISKILETSWGENRAMNT